MTYKPASTLFFALFSLLLVSCDEKKDATEMVLETAKQLPRGTAGGAAYMLEMDGPVGWVPTILVFGYVDNLSACQEVAAYAKKTSPSRSFRCMATN